MTCYNAAFMPRNEMILSYNPASYAVADAMMLAQINLIDRDWDFFPDAHAALSSQERRLLREDMMMQRTNGECLTSVRSVIDHLSSAHAKKFKSITALVADTHVSPILHDWTKHYYFLAQDLSDTWYAGSPANHLNIDLASRLTTPFVSRDLETVLAQIEERESGRWPDVTYITEIAETPILRMPQVHLDPATNLHHRFVTTMVNLGGNNNWSYQLELCRR